MELDMKDKNLSSLLAVSRFEFIRFFNLKSELFGLAIIVLFIVFRGGSSALFAITTEEIKIGVLTTSTNITEFQSHMPESARVNVSALAIEEASLRNDLEQGLLDGYLKRGDDGKSAVLVTVENETWQQRLVPLARVMEQVYLANRFNTDKDVFASTLGEFEVVVSAINQKSTNSQNIWAISMVILVVSVMAILTAFTQLVSGITNEKFSKVSEMILACLPVHIWIDGKVIAAALHGLKVFFTYSILTVIGLEVMELISIEGLTNEFRGVVDILLVLYVFFTGFVFWCYFYSLLSVMIKSPNSQVKNTVSLAPLVVLAVCVTGLDSVGSLFMTILSFVPLTYSFSMPLQILTGQVGYAEVAFASIVVLVCAYVCRALTIKLFTKDVMQSASWSGDPSLT
jgi:ABC-2 type transport system permease protein